MTAVGRRFRLSSRMAVFRAYIDESGQRASTAASSDHFVMSAVVVRRRALAQTTALLAQIRQDLGRGPSDELHWKNIKTHAQRLRAAQLLGLSSDITISSVVVCKRKFGPSVSLKDEDRAYLYTLRFLLERLSWFARDRSGVLGYTLAHIVRFKLTTLRQYEARLRAMRPPDCRIDWASLDPHGGRIDQPSRLEQLQLADIAASATACAFEPDKFGNTEDRYLREMAPRLYRYPGGAITSYGLKMHPWNAASQGAHGWASAL